MPENFFISYATKDAQQFALRLHDELEGDGFHAWLDKRDIRPTDSWAQAIEQGLRECVGVLVILTPAAIASTVCKNELSMAHTLKKPLLPILITPDTPDAQPLAGDLIPLVLQGKQYISFVSSFEQGIAKLRPALHRILELTRSIDAKQQQIADLEQKRPDAPRPQALERAIEDLQGDISTRQSVLLDPEAFIETYRRSTETELESIRQNRKQAAEKAAQSTRQRVVGTLPQGLTESFKDRSDERSKIVNVLLSAADNKRVVSIIGRGGVGKTALACNVLHDLEKDHTNVHGIAYLSAATRANTLTLERIFSSIGAMLGGDAEKAISDIWSNPNLTAETRIVRLLDHVRDHRCILLFDNLEDALDDGGRLMDPDVQTFLDSFLTRQHAARIVITSREPLNPADDARHYEYVLPLNDGLPADYAVELLRDLDPGSELGLHGADAALLQQIAAKTFGIPRALEAVVGLLATDPLLTPEALLKDRELWGRGVTEKLVARAQSRLNADQQLVMQALALFGRPVREAAVRYLLEPFAETGLDVSKTLRQLARGRYITVNRSTGEITIHPLDKEYNYRQIATHHTSGRPVVIVVLVEVTDWERRAGDYYKQVRGTPADWKEYDDLAPILAEFEHRVRAGDYQTALNIVDSIGYQFLRLWGYLRVELELRQQLSGKLVDLRIEAQNTYQMGQLYSALSYFQDALRCYEQALPIALKDQNAAWEGQILGSIGAIYRNLQSYDKALEYLETALSSARALANRADEASSLHAIGLVFDTQGRLLSALKYYHESLTIRQSLDNEREHASTLLNIALIQTAVGDFTPARQSTEQALQLAERSGYRNGFALALRRLGLLDQLEGRYESAFQRYQRSLQIAIDTGDRRSNVRAAVLIVGLYPHIISAKECAEHLDSLHVLANDIASHEAIGSAWYASVYFELHSGVFERALISLNSTLPHISPDRKYTLHRDFGLTYWRLRRNGESREALQVCIDEADKLLAETPNMYAPKYARGLALAGLALITGDSMYMDDARAAYESAIANCAARGVLDEAIEWLDLLAGERHKDQVAGLRALLISAH